ncbi:DUF6344 domain-containing protein [Streptomyces sp. H10-C2]|uniref:DUF6344 domain-containing protein n=1 Tax=unclassified Streptomyces TaxID=2593676 RepID=UPI0024BBA7C7|nr:MULTISPECIES: DUF6344 domain-containing protein [unclassified Streptomyces]MDJ0340329.1 DUF6344 domain-containing protein [Streptomyces sp. PH10-H1]MDJ0368223.1 DUF6344 domain-containing protein [Streptomyces sp. H10-C2]
MTTTASTVSNTITATTRVAKMWAVFITVLARLLTSLRLIGPAQVPAARRPADEPVRPAGAARTAPLAGGAPPRERSLPPTIKQRIRAEAHGASPVSRQRTADIGDMRLASPAGDLLSAAALVPTADRFNRVPCAV